MEAAKKIMDVEIHHLDKFGYGPGGALTRREWRALCMEKLLAGKAVFEAWQNSWADAENNVDFGYTLICDDGSREDFNLRSLTTVLDFVGQSFDAILDAEHLNFKAVDFSASTFSKDARFNRATFGRYAVFEKTIFSGHAGFNSVTFSGRVDFESAIFSGYTGFDSAIFGHAIFKKATFSGDARFNRTTFSGHAGFDNATFSGYAGFDSATFSGHPCFDRATFSGDTRFNIAKFSGDVSFNKATFSGGTEFKNATFSGDVVFRSSCFEKSVSFFKAEFHSQSRFDSEWDEATQQWQRATQFKGKVNFENAVFKNVGHFERVKFTTQVPSFLGVDTATTRLEFSVDDGCFPAHDASDSAVRGLEQLKRLADEHGQVDQALMFNALELRAKRLFAWQALGQLDWWPRACSGEWWVNGVTWLYEKTSDYGRSFMQPFKCYLLLLLTTFFLALWHVPYHVPARCDNARNIFFSDLNRAEEWCEPSGASSPESIAESKAKFDEKIHLTGSRAAFEYVLYRSAGVLDFSDNGKATDAVAQRLFGAPFEPWWMRVWGVLKAISTTGLLFLMALGLRNKYRLK
ncbi:MAG: pentapeptide repeat-containing protein [Formosimonas sp.]